MINLPPARLLILPALLLSGCVTGIPTVSPEVIGRGALMSGNWRQSPAEGRDAFYVVSVDGALVQKPTRMRDWRAPFSIGPGERLVVIDYEGIDPGPLARPRIAKATVKATLQRGVRYIADGRDDGLTVTLWIARLDNGQHVSSEVVALKEDAQYVQPIFVPAPRAAD